MWAAQRFPSHVTQRKPLPSQAILLQASDWTFLYDLNGPLQFPIEAAVTSLRPDGVLLSRSSKTIVPRELTVRFSRGKCLLSSWHPNTLLLSRPVKKMVLRHMFVFGSWMSWLLHLLLPPLLQSPRPAKVGSASNPWRQKPPFAPDPRMSLFFAEACRLGCVKVFFTEPCPHRSAFWLFIFFLLFLCYFRFVLFASWDNGPYSPKGKMAAAYPPVV